MTGSKGDDQASVSPGGSPSMRIGRYVVARELGRGGMGIVYEATDPAIGRRVAIKVINLQYMTGAGEAQVMRERLFREARSAGALSHPGIVGVYDVGEDREMAFIAMEYVNGPSLQQVLQLGGKLQVADVVEILGQIAGALDYAHRHGVVHRDIKPPNIMLHNGSQVKIADFGIAKITTAPKYTATGLVMGTPAYMSPEQIEGREVDGKSDQFSLAVVAYELLTGKVPFQGGTYASVVHSIVYGARPSARAANPLLPEAFDGVLGRAMATLPQDRFASCTEFVQALDTARQATLQAAPPPVAVPIAKPAPSPPVRSAGRLKIIAAALLLVALALAGAVAYRFWPVLRQRTGQQAHKARPVVTNSSVGAPSGAPAQSVTPEQKQIAGDAPKPAVQADLPPPSQSEPPPKTAAPVKTGKTSTKKNPVVLADASPPPQPKQVERQPVVSIPRPPTTQTVVVKADQGWTDTGIDLSTGDTAAIVASGQIRISGERRLGVQQPGGFYPNCSRARELFGQPLAAVPAPNVNCWSLIARVGQRGAIFGIGVQGAVPGGSAGRLYLGVNGDAFADNTGFWSAVVTVEHH